MRKNFVHVLGLPLPLAGYRISSLGYCAAAQTLIVTIDAVDERRLFVRRVDEAAYEEVIFPRGSAHVSDVIISDGAPFAFALAVERTRSGSLDYHGVYAISLPDRVVTRLPDITTQVEYAGLWITKLLSASADGANLYVVVACQELPKSDGGWSVAYKVSSLFVETGVICELATLMSPGA